MRLLLINNNPAVSRLINLSAEKYGYEIEEFKGDDFDLNENFDITIADNEAVSDNSMLLLRESGNLGEIIYVGPKGLPKPIYANHFLQKPFLPTDFIELIKTIEKANEKKDTSQSNIKSTESFIEDDTKEVSDKEEENIIALDLDNMDSLDLPMPNDDDFLLYEEEKLEDDIGEKDEATKEDSALESDDENFDMESEEQLRESDENQEDVSKEPEEENEVENLEADSDIPQELKLDENIDEKESGTAILDSEDIDEVKQLLDDEIATDEIDDVKDSELKEIAQDEEKEEDVSEDDFDIGDEVLVGETNIETAMDDISGESEVLGGLIQESQDLVEPEDILKEIDKIEEEAEETTLEIKEPTEEEVQEQEDEKDEETPMILSEEKVSIDDISEEDLDGLFEEEQEVSVEQKHNVDAEEMKEELETKIVNDVKKVLDKDEIREALKGLRVNISISFDEE